MFKLINQIKKFKDKNYLLFFDKDRIGQEMKSNLISISSSMCSKNQDRKKLLVDVLMETIYKIEKKLCILHPNHSILFLIWFDEEAKFLRWSIISDVNQNNLPFSSDVEEVKLHEIIENWLDPKCTTKQVTEVEINNMSQAELRLLINSLEIPTLEVFIHRTHQQGQALPEKNHLSKKSES